MPSIISADKANKKSNHFHQRTYTEKKQIKLVIGFLECLQIGMMKIIQFIVNNSHEERKIYIIKCFINKFNWM